MSGIKALEKLRGLRDEAASKMVDNPRWVCMRAEAIADEIEAEVAERFCEIPVDVNGELCKCGDEIHLTDEDERLMVCGYTVGKDGFVSLYCSKLKDGRRWFPTVMTYASEVEHADSIGRVALDMRDSISEHVGLAPDEVLAFVERLQRLERAE